MDPTMLLALPECAARRVYRILYNRAVLSGGGWGTSMYFAGRACVAETGLCCGVGCDAVDIVTGWELK